MTFHLRALWSAAACAQSENAQPLLALLPHVDDATAHGLRWAAREKIRPVPSPNLRAKKTAGRWIWTFYTVSREWALLIRSHLPRARPSQQYRTHEEAYHALGTALLAIRERVSVETNKE